MMAIWVCPRVKVHTYMPVQRAEERELQVARWLAGLHCTRGTLRALNVLDIALHTWDVTCTKRAEYQRPWY
jgi:hypothetical protein